MGITNVASANVATYETSALGTVYYLSLGTSTTAFVKTQTALVAETSASGLARGVADSAVNATTTVANDTVRCTKAFTSGASATITEVGLFKEDYGGTIMVGRTVLTTPRVLVSGDVYTLIYNWVFAS